MRPSDDRDDGLPPWWLESLLVGSRSLVEVPGDPFWAVQSCLPGTGLGQVHTTAPLIVPTVYFVVVDGFDTALVISMHALVWEPETLAGGAWWSLVEGGWIRDVAPIGPGLRLRWLPADEVLGVTAAVQAFYTRARRAREPDVVRARIERAVADQAVGVIDLEPVYIQWAGYPDGVYLEVGDGKATSEQFDGQLWADLRWLGWEAPSSGQRNAWSAATGEDAVGIATDLVVRTVDGLVRAEARRRAEMGLELMRCPASTGLIGTHGTHLRADAPRDA